MLKFTYYVLYLHNKILCAFGSVPFCWVCKCPSAQNANATKGAFYFVSAHLKKSIPLSILQSPINHGTLYYWLKIRMLYKHPVILNYSAYRLGKLLNMCHKAIDAHIKRMLAAGLCYLKDGHLYFKGISALKTGACVMIPVSDKHNTVLQIRNAIIQHNLNQQQRQVSKKSNAVKIASTEWGKLPKSTTKAINRAGGLEAYSRQHIPYLTLSNRKFGQLINLSIHSGRRLQRMLNESGLLKSIHKYKLLMENVSLEYYNSFREYSNLNGLRFMNNCIVQQLSNRIEQQMQL